MIKYLEQLAEKVASMPPIDSPERYFNTRTIKSELEAMLGEMVLLGDLRAVAIASTVYGQICNALYTYEETDPHKVFNDMAAKAVRRGT